MQRRAKPVMNISIGIGALIVHIVLAGGMPASASEPRAATPTARTERENWMPQHNRFVAEARKGGIDLLFIGDSITKGWARGGLNVWKAHYAPRRAANFGISGDCTEHVLWRIQNGELDGINPTAVVLLIGTNNINNHDSPEDIAIGVTAIVEEFRCRLPAAHILLIGVFPKRELATHPDRERIRELNRLLARLHARDHVTFFDFGDRLLQPDGSISKEIMYDFTHLTPQGYEIWVDMMDPVLQALRTGTKDGSLSVSGGIRGDGAGIQDR
jgi:lysophospholipase L1-like esterase